jgi:hypothetical protein
MFSGFYNPTEDVFVYVFNITDAQHESVVKPFLEGKYSEVDRTYVEKYFPSVPSHHLYTNRLIFDKDDKVKRMWEKKLDVELPKGAEVWSKPQPKNEIYGFLELREGSIQPAV